MDKYHRRDWDPLALEGVTGRSGHILKKKKKGKNVDFKKNPKKKKQGNVFFSVENRVIQ